MRFSETPLRGAFVLHPETVADDRGTFTRTFCAREFEEHGLSARVAQSSVATTGPIATIRGMHFQVAPDLESKLVRCLKGRIFDVIVDLRPESSSYLEYHAVELGEDNGLQLYVPERFAHGYQTLTADTVVSYSMNAFYAPESQRGIRFDDPRLGIEWPLTVELVTERDRSWPLVDEILVELSALLEPR